MPEKGKVYDVLKAAKSAICYLRGIRVIGKKRCQSVKKKKKSAEKDVGQKKTSVLESCGFRYKVVRFDG